MSNDSKTDVFPAAFSPIMTFVFWFNVKFASLIFLIFLKESLFKNISYSLNGITT